MDVLVMLADQPHQQPVLAHVNSMPASLQNRDLTRNVVTFYGAPDADSLALGLAAAVESHRTASSHEEAIRHLGVWAERDAVGDAAWRDATGQLVTQDVEIPLEILKATATQLLVECGQLIRRIAAGLAMPDWPEGARRAITVSLGPIRSLAAPLAVPVEGVLDRVREADALAFEYEGD